MRLFADMPNARDRRSAGRLAALLALLPILAAGQQDDSQPDGETGLELVNLSILDSRDGYAIPADSRFLPGEPVERVVVGPPTFAIDGDDRTLPFLDRWAPTVAKYR